MGMVVEVFFFFFLGQNGFDFGIGIDCGDGGWWCQFFGGNFGGEELVFVTEFWWNFGCVGLSEKQRERKERERERREERELNRTFLHLWMLMLLPDGSPLLMQTQLLSL